MMNMSVVRVCFFFMCECVYLCLPVVSVREVVDNGRADAGHAPLAVVPSSCDDRELRSTETLFALYTERGQSRTKHTQNTVILSNLHSESVKGELTQAENVLCWLLGSFESLRFGPSNSVATWGSLTLTNVPEYSLTTETTWKMGPLIRFWSNWIQLISLQTSGECLHDQ